MMCIKCDHDVADCICDDRAERLKSLMASQYLHLGDDYRERIQRNIDSAERGEKARKE